MAGVSAVQHGELSLARWLLSSSCQVVSSLQVKMPEVPATMPVPSDVLAAGEGGGRTSEG
eukprot:764470-Hanusia_phi.AAC.4